MFFLINQKRNEFVRRFFSFVFSSRVRGLLRGFSGGRGNFVFEMLDGSAAGEIRGKNGQSHLGKICGQTAPYARRRVADIPQKKHYPKTPSSTQVKRKSGSGFANGKNFRKRNPRSGLENRRHYSRAVAQTQTSSKRLQSKRGICPRTERRNGRSFFGRYNRAEKTYGNAD